MKSNNYIFVGDNLRVMDSEDFKKMVSMVDMIYIDPPYLALYSFFISIFCKVPPSLAEWKI